MRERSTETLDQLDLTLIRELEIDARRSYPDLAEKLGSTPTTVARRLQRLLDQRIVAIATVADPLAVGYQTIAMLLVNARPGMVDSIADQLASFRHTKSISITTGRYDIFAYCVFPASEDLVRFLSEGLGGISGIAAVETMLTLKSVKSSWTYFIDREEPVQRRDRVRRLSELELSIIRELELDPRQPVTELATKFPTISRSTVRRRLITLMDQDVVRVVSVLDPLALGYDFLVNILIKVEPGKVLAVATEVARFREAKQVSITAGRFDIFVWAAFKDSQDMYSFIGKELGGIPGVMRHETMITVKVRRRSFALLT